MDINLSALKCSKCSEVAPLSIVMRSCIDGGHHICRKCLTLSLISSVLGTERKRTTDDCDSIEVMAGIVNEDRLRERYIDCPMCVRGPEMQRKKKYDATQPLDSKC